MKLISLKTVALAAPVALLAGITNCAPDDPLDVGTAGSSTSGGMTSTGGMAAGGMTTTGGAAPSGGSSAGTPAGGVATGGGGSGGMAGAAAGTGGSGGTPAGDACDPGGDPAKCIDDVAGKVSDYGVYPWKSSWFVTGCADKQGHDCITVPSCPNQNAQNFEDKGGLTLETFQLGGVKGQKYKVTFTFNALSEAKVYEKGTRDTGTTVPPNPEAAVWDTFYRDGNPVPSNYNVLKLTVFDDNGMHARHYYMNSFPPGGDNWESHRTFLISYTKSIVVVGGGKITYLVQDSNCHAIDNCGAGNVPDDSCNAPRTIPNEATAMLPAMYKDPVDGKVKATASLNELSNGSVAQPWHSQAGHFTITKIEKTNDPVTMDYK